MKSKFIIAAVAALGICAAANAQTNLQMFYDFGRGYATTTIEGFYGDSWGDTFFFFDHYYGTKDDAKANIAGACNGSYFEIERGINFWQNSALKDLSAMVEYDGSTWGAGIFCFGAKYFLHSADFKNTFTFALLYDKHIGVGEADTPLKGTFVWGLQDLFGVTGLRFSGFADVWGNNQLCANDSDVKATKCSFLTEPQLWYNIGQHFNLPNLNIGGEVEISCNFAGHLGFMCNPCIGAKYVF